MPNFQFPPEYPEDRLDAIWTLQHKLMSEAERHLGRRDLTKELCQPIFSEDGPHIRNSPNFDQAWAELSPNASKYWPTTVYELAHETIHLLNPIPGHTNYLEEGLAVAFSVKMVRAFSGQSMKPGTEFPLFTEAWSLVKTLPGGPLPGARKIRAREPILANATPALLQEIFPRYDYQKIVQLCSPCIPRPRIAE